LLREVELPKNSFMLEGELRDVPCVFQIWVRRDVKRHVPKRESTHPDFKFVTRDEATIVIQRVGARAGTIHLRFGMSESSHLFVRASRRVVTKLRRLDLANAARDTAGCPSISKSEIVKMYRDLIDVTHA
jgi:hypothetical protein